jgi:flagellar basal-body rod protein FlgB
VAIQLLLNLAMLNGISAELERYMDLLSARQKLVARNIANADTPGYHTQDIDFQTEFERQLTGPSEPNVQEAQGLPAKKDGNNVNIDREMRLVAENAIRFNMASQLVRSEIRTLRTAITEGKS